MHSWPDHRLYVGQSSNGLINGLGKYSWPDGRTYEGEYKNDQKEGFGIYTWPDGKMYRGYWKEGKQHGLSQFVYTDEQQKEEVKYGLWENGTRTRLFEVLKTIAIDQQLKAIEEKLI